MRTTGTYEWASVFAIVGGLLILLEALLDPYYAYYAFGAFGIVAGFAIAGLGYGLRREPRYRREMGAVIVVISLVSFLGIDGFYLGALLGVIGGVLAFTSPGGSYFRPTDPDRVGRALGDLCPRCGRHIPLWVSKCPYCGSSGP